jgi:S1-C subfamily serine protease
MYSSKLDKKAPRNAVLTGALFALLSGCGGGHATQKKVVQPTGPAPDAWRKQALQLNVEGFMFSGGTQPSAASWAGSGSWIAPNIAVTNAHVALRGLKITGKDDLGKTYDFDEILAVDEEADLAIIKTKGLGKTYDFDEILAVDEEADLAIIKTKGQSDSHLDIEPKPADPKSLRGKEVRVIGNTGNLGLSFYDGRITNVVGDDNNPVLLHDANTAGGSSGGPLISKDGKLVGVNHSSLPSLNAKAAAPSWVVQRVFDEGMKHQALALKDAFDPANLPVDWYVERAVCLKPGEAYKGVFATVATNDLVADITPAQNAPMGFVLTDGQEDLAEAVVNNEAQGAWTLHGGGQYVFGVVNPKDATAAACATVKFGRINWKERFK